MAQKISSIFDWSQTQIEYNVFYETIEKVLLRPRDMQKEEHIRNFKKFAYCMFNMNCDGGICEADLFTFLELHSDNEFFKKALIFDIQDISNAFSIRNKHLIQTDKVMDYSDPSAPKIKNLPEYLNRTKKRNRHLVDIHE